MAFKNIQKEKVLELELRKRIFDLVCEYAGIHLRELERKSAIAYSTLKYHLHFLTKHGLILEKKGNGTIQYYPATIKPENIEILGLLRQKNIRRILVFLLHHDTCTIKTLEQFMKLAPSTISWYLNGLIRKEIIKKTGQGSKVIYKLAYEKEKLMGVLITYQESFIDKLIDKTVEMWELR